MTFQKTLDTETEGDMMTSVRPPVNITLIGTENGSSLVVESHGNNAVTFVITDQDGEKRITVDRSLIKNELEKQLRNY